jgi:metallo-beta-lactamase class B
MVCRKLMAMRSFCFRILLLLFLSTCATAQTAPAQTNGTDYLVPFPAHHVISNIYFVGSKGLGIYLVTTPRGHILINAGVEDSVPLIQQSVEKLGFKFSDIKLLLISHAHFDHDAGAARIKQLTGAKYAVMDADVAVVESGGKQDFFYGNIPGMLYPAAKVDRVLHDGDTVSLGGSVLTAHRTAGHTKGCTTWTMKVQENGKSYDVVIVGSPNVNPGYKLVNDAAYPQMASDFEKTFDSLRTLHTDVFLGAHGAYYGMEAKYAALKNGASNPFIDPEGYKKYVADREQAFRAELGRQITSK